MLNREKQADGKFVSPEMQLNLTAPILMKIKTALFDIDDEKSPGPDGFGAFFFKKDWEVVGRDVVLAVTEFFRTGQMLKQWNHAFIVLVSKSTHSNLVTDFRPISCCNVFLQDHF